LTLIFLIVHLVVAAALVGLVLTQRSEGGALGMGGGSSSLISGRGAADFLARLTMWAGALFFVTSLALTWMARDRTDAAPIDLSDSSLLDSPAAPVAATPAAPAPESDPSAPVAPSPDQALQRAGPLTRAPEPEPQAIAPAPARAAPAQPAPATPSPAAGGRQETPAIRPSEPTRAPAQRSSAERATPAAQPPAETSAVEDAAPEQPPQPAPIPVRPRGGPEE